MSDQPAPAEATPPATPPQADPPKPEDQAPPWLPDRLKQARAAERKALLQDIGVDDPAALKAKLKKLDELESAKLSDQERVEKLIKELSPKAEQAERLSTLFSSVVESKFTTLSEKQQQAIDAVASGNAEKRWELMQVMEAAGFGVVGAPAPKPPAQTAPTGAQPPPAPAQPKSMHDKWQELQKSDSVAASIFHQLNAMAIGQSRKE